MNELGDNNLNRFLASGRGDPSQATGTDLEGNPLLPSPGETIDSPWGQSMVDRIVPRYSSEAVRDASILSPVEGQLCYILEVDEFQIYDGADWIRVGDGIYLPLTAGLDNPLTGRLDIKAGRNPIDMFNTIDSVTDDGGRLRFRIDEGEVLFQIGSADGVTVPIATVASLHRDGFNVDNAPVGVRRFFVTRTLTATIEGVEDLFDVVDLSGAGIVNRNNCVVNIMATQNLSRAQRRVYGWHSFTPTAYPDTITVHTTALESASGTGDFIYDISIIEYMP